MFEPFPQAPESPTPHDEGLAAILEAAAQPTNNIKTNENTNNNDGVEQDTQIVPKQIPLERNPVPIDNKNSVPTTAPITEEDAF